MKTAVVIAVVVLAFLAIAVVVQILPAGPQCSKVVDCGSKA